MNSTKRQIYNSRIFTSSDSKKGIIAQLSALKLDGIKLIDRFDYRIDEKLVNNKDDRKMISYDKDNFIYTDNPDLILSEFKNGVVIYQLCLLKRTILKKVLIVQ